MATHPLFTDNAFFLHDVGIVKLVQPVAAAGYGVLPTPNLLDTFKKKDVTFTSVGYGLQKSFPDAAAWKDVGLNPYGNTIIVNGDYLKKNKPVVANFVKVTQKAFAACVVAPKPCVQAMLDANGALQFDNELTNWSLVEVLMSDKTSREVALGIHDDARMKADYELVRDYVGIDKPFDVKTTYTNEFLDRSVKMSK
jgi:ABC-type nitrate/sulfonate/bicarbonate transport system substrate-binding protein